MDTGEEKLMSVLTWEKPPKAEPYEEWAQYQADDAPPGTYAPNMDADWKSKWKAKLCGQRSGELRVEIRKSFCIERSGSVQGKFIVNEDGTMLVSMNGTAGFTDQDIADLFTAITEARDMMKRWRRAHPREETVAL